ncbi:MAG: UDP-N-acetylmuramate dehydrogenase [Candidatus Berkelbacteria bacterium Licking1014_85]|uniref:UDP-N-acetylenolpyruvoylglucosamine reductase n=1 Tax=Candidatus Berkelbacteria bacterium Licking1014_85 TaxID=2017148 RepID=A0A554LLK3_9BACT|nr:MAG: UDP-N-acetylmuramate dehydrogenase [Candidatus Berkelbacteria bacterium Licking1014_85]
MTNISSKFQTNIPLSKYSRMRVGGDAKYLLEAKDLNEIISAIKYAQENNIDYIVVGEGANIIFSDYGFDGLVIINQSSTISFLENNLVIVDSGVKNNHFVLKCAEKNLGGLDYLAAIPGTIGGAIYGNAGAFGNFITDLIESVTLFLPDGNIAIKSKSQLKPLYRSTLIKRVAKRDKRLSPIILSAKFKLMSSHSETIIKSIKELDKIRQKRQPKNKYFVSGSTFKNPAGRPSGKNENTEFIHKTAAWLLDDSGAKKIKIDGARVSLDNANWIENNGKAAAQDIYAIVSEMKKAVLAKHQIKLEEEIEFIGKFE